MSIVDREQAGPGAGSPEDPFRLGYRYPRRELPDGEFEYDREPIPLTLEDLLFPEEYDHATHHPEHARVMTHVAGCLNLLAAEDPRLRVLFDCRVDYAIPGVRPLGPDVSAFLDVPDDWGTATLDVGETGARPVLVVEITSPETREQDFGPKVDYYHRAGVPCYVVVDLRYRGKLLQGINLVGFRHAPDGYEPIPRDDRGRLRVEPLGLWLAVVDGQVACLDRAGEVMQIGVDLYKSRQAEVARADAESRRADSLQQTAETALRQVEALMATNDRLVGQVEVLQGALKTSLATNGQVMGQVDFLQGALRTSLAMNDQLVGQVEALQTTNHALVRQIDASREIADLHKARADAEAARAREFEARAVGLEEENRRLRGEG